MGWSRWATFLDHWKREDFWCNFRFQIEPLAPVSAIERHLVMKGFGQPQTENSSGPEDNMSDSDDENDATPVSFPAKFGHRKFSVFYWFYAWHTTSWAVNQGQTATSKYNYLSGTNRTNFGVEHFLKLFEKFRPFVSMKLMMNPTLNRTMTTISKVFGAEPSP